MAGLSRQGLEIKTLDDVLTDYKTNAASIFSDLVPLVTLLTQLAYLALDV